MPFHIFSPIFQIQSIQGFQPPKSTLIKILGFFFHPSLCQGFCTFYLDFAPQNFTYSFLIGFNNSYWDFLSLHKYIWSWFLRSNIYRLDSNSLSISFLGFLELGTQILALFSFFNGFISLNFFSLPVKLKNLAVDFARVQLFQLNFGDWNIKSGTSFLQGFFLIRLKRKQKISNLSRSSVQRFPIWISFCWKTQRKKKPRIQNLNFFLLLFFWVLIDLSLFFI